MAVFVAWHSRPGRDRWVSAKNTGTIWCHIPIGALCFASTHIIMRTSLSFTTCIYIYSHIIKNKCYGYVIESWAVVCKNKEIFTQILLFSCSRASVFGDGSAQRHQFAAIIQEMSIPMYVDEVSSTFEGIQAVCDDRLSKRALTEWFLDQKKKLSDPGTSAKSWLKGRVASCAQLRLRFWNWWRVCRGQVGHLTQLLSPSSLLACPGINAPSSFPSSAAWLT